MALLLGIDIGTTTCSAVAIDAPSGQIVAGASLPNRAAIAPPANDPGRHELDLVALGDLAVELLARAAQSLGRRASEIQGIGVTGQQHGLALLGPRNEPLGHAITWQDRRVEQLCSDCQETCLQRMIAQAGGPGAFSSCGCLPRVGYMGPTLYWLRQQGHLASNARACFIPDAVVTFLSDEPPCCDATNGGGSGIFDITRDDWHWEIVERLGLPAAILPPVRPSGQPIGGLLPDTAARTNVPAWTPVCVALGDNQASFVGSVADPQQSVLINVGTGSQLSAMVKRYVRLDDPEVETRSLPAGGYLLVYAGLFGGRSYAYLREFYRAVGVTLFGAAGDTELYDAMNAAASQVPAGSDGLVCTPTFTGTRADPSQRASFCGLSPANFFPGHLTRALLEGMANGFHTFYQRMLPHIGERQELVGTGNGIRKNRLCAQILAQRFEKPLRIPEHIEAGAVGAALLAGVRLGILPDMAAIGHLLRYRQIPED